MPSMDKPMRHLDNVGRNIVCMQNCSTETRAQFIDRVNALAAAQGEPTEQDEPQEDQPA
jgi:hypothetical protein